MSYPAGASGHVGTLDVDDDLTEGARANLAAAGFTNVDVVTRDCALGHAEGAVSLVVATAPQIDARRSALCASWSSTPKGLQRSVGSLRKGPPGPPHGRT